MKNVSLWVRKSKNGIYAFITITGLLVRGYHSPSAVTVFCTDNILDILIVDGSFIVFIELSWSHNKQQIHS